VKRGKTFIGVSGINAIDNPGSGIGVARSLKEDKSLKPVIVGLAYDAMEPGIYMDWIVDKSYIMPYPSTSGDAYFERLLYIKDNYGLDCIIPSLDVELPFYLKYSERLAAKGIRTFLPGKKELRHCGKDRLAGIARKIGMKLPRTEVVNSPDMLAHAVGKIGLPVMVKGCFYRANRANTFQEAVNCFNKLVAEWGYPVIIQEVLSGVELNVVGLGDGEGRSMGLVGIKKVALSSLGKIWTGVTIRHEKMLDASMLFIKSVKWRGPFELECMAVADDIYLIEINPRFPAWSYFATGVGVNLPSRMLRKLMDRRVDCSDDYEAGKLFVRYSYEMVTEMDMFQKAVTRGENP